MRFQRAISVLTLSAFLPIAVGCAGPHSRLVCSDPRRDDPTSGNNWLSLEEPVAVQGYTDREDEFHEWEGWIRGFVPDSLEFVRPVIVPSATWNWAEMITAEVLRLDVQDVMSVRLAPTRFNARKVALGVFIGLAVLAALVLAAASTADWGMGSASVELDY